MLWTAIDKKHIHIYIDLIVRTPVREVSPDINWHNPFTTIIRVIRIAQLFHAHNTILFIKDRN